MPNILLVMAGGALGAGLRYLVGLGALRLFGPGFPWGTWAVNIVGGLAMGLLAGWLALRGEAGDEPLRLLLGVGVLGGFTTFSAFSLEMFNMLARGESVLALAYAISSVAGSVIALWTGVWLVRSFA
ncbi:MAG: fluoride efflux transporter CrcB [Alphaproteobacteria bacterium]|nr:fluoride efflux transporter CrcB [Alphaproteobacteria bacterium]